MRVWLIKDSEVLPLDDGNQRLARMALIADELSNVGDEVIWWTSTFSHFAKKKREYKDGNVKIKNNYSIFMLDSQGYEKNVSVKRLLHNWRIARKFYKFAQKEKKPDIILVDLPTISFVNKAIKYGHKYSVPVIVDVRDLNPDVFPDAFTGIKKNMVKMGIVPLKWILRKSMKRATAIVGTTQPYLDFGLKYSKRDQSELDRVFYVAYPENKSGLDIKSINKWKSYNIENKFVVCFFGQFGNMVDIETVLGAARICKKDNSQAVFVLCGNGEKLEQYRNEAKDLDNVIFPGWVNSDEIRALGAISRVGLMAYKPSKNYELQMPNKFSEYLSMGLIVFVQPDGIMKGVVDSNDCGYCYKTSEDLAKLIDLIASDSLKNQKMSENARKLYEKQFCAERVYKEFADYIHEIGNEFQKKR